LRAYSIGLRVLIELTGLLGASRIFATGEPEHHPLLESLGTNPLRKRSFGWELFLEKIGLVPVAVCRRLRVREQAATICRYKERPAWPSRTRRSRTGRLARGDRRGTLWWRRARRA